jgi:CRP-like cAMP-binding protein
VKHDERTLESDPLVNELLRHLPADEWERVSAESRIITLRYAEVLFNDDEPPDMAFFPLTALISMMAVMRNGDEIEYGSIGREGMVGLQVALGAQALRGRAICQLEGEVLALPGAAIRESDRTPELHRLLMRYAQATINVLAQSAACNALHSVRQRTARWLLITRDRAGVDDFALTQDFLSKMLGVRRAGVTDVAGELQRELIIEYARGHIRVLDAGRLREISCECYDLIHDEYTRVFETAPETTSDEEIATVRR